MTTFAKSLTTLLGLSGLVTSALAQTPGTVSFKATIAQVTHPEWGTDHIVVAWVTKADGTFIKTLWKQGNFGWTDSEWTKNCPTWNTARGGVNGSKLLDGYSGATATNYSTTVPTPPARANNPISPTWNGLGIDGVTVMPDGDYKLWIQYGTSDAAGPVTTNGLLWTKGAASFSKSDYAAASFSNISVTWTPAISTPSVSVAVSPASVTEDGATNLVYTFTRSNSTGSLVTNFSVGGTATYNTDYTQTGATSYAASSGTVTFAAGSLTTAVTINPTADITVESNEAVVLTVTTGSGYTVGSPAAATGTITTDDTAVSVAVSPASVAENGGTNLLYTFTRAGVTSGMLTTNFSVGGTATYNTDYTQSGAAGFSASSGTVVFAAGSAAATVTITPVADTTLEPDETVVLTLATGTGYTVGSPAAATGTIANDDTAYSSWASVLPAGQNGPNHTPKNDGVSNLMKYACNLDPTKPDVRTLTVDGSGMAGLPGKAVVGGKLRMEFLRRKDPGLAYTPQFWSGIATDPWVDFAGTPTVTQMVPVSDTWERVVVDDPGTGATRFGRVKVSQTP